MGRSLVVSLSLLCLIKAVSCEANKTTTMAIVLSIVGFVGMLIICGIICNKCVPTSFIQDNITVEPTVRSEDPQNEPEININEDRLHKKHWSKGSRIQQSQICTICLDTQPLVKTRCGHFIHTYCLIEWRRRQKTKCPNCSESISIVRVYCAECRKKFVTSKPAQLKKIVDNVERKCRKCRRSSIRMLQPSVKKTGGKSSKKSKGKREIIEQVSEPSADSEIPQIKVETI